jgi:hypothetical protein
MWSTVESIPNPIVAAPNGVHPDVIAAYNKASAAAAKPAAKK